MLQPDFEKLLGVLYDADGGTGDFTPFLSALGRNMKSHVLAIQTYDARSSGIGTESSIGIDSSWEGIYSDVASENLWFIRGAPRLLSQGICDDGQMDCAQEVRRTRFHADFLRPTDIGHGMAFRLGTEPGGQMAVLAVNRSATMGGFDEADRQLALRLLPHLQNAHSLRIRLKGLEASQRAFEATLDQMREGIVHLAADGTMLFANETAQVLMSNGALVRREASRLAPVHTPDCAAFHEALGSIAATFSGAVRTLGLHGPDGRLGALLTLCPAPPPVTPWAMQHAAAIAFIRPLEHVPGQGGEHLKVAWQFTRAESRLALLLVRGLSLEEAAHQTGVTKNTVRAQIRSIYEKTGTHRQAELVALLCRTA